MDDDELRGGFGWPVESSREADTEHAIFCTSSLRSPACPSARSPATNRGREAPRQRRGSRRGWPYGPGSLRCGRFRKRGPAASWAAVRGTRRALATTSTALWRLPSVSSQDRLRGVRSMPMRCPFCRKRRRARLACSRPTAEESAPSRPRSTARTKFATLRSSSISLRSIGGQVADQDHDVHEGSSRCQ